MASSDGDAERSAVSRYLTSNQNLAGSVGAVIGLILFFTGVVGGLWPIVVLGLYGAGALAVPPSRRAQLGAGPRRLGPDELRDAMDDLEARVSGQVPREVLAAVERIDGAVREVLDRRGTLPSTSADAFAIERAVVDYLPTALDAYLRLPRSYADTTPIDGRRTARRVLLDQLALLEARLAEVIADLSRGDTEKLLAHERFLRERFSAPPSELSLPQ